MPDRQPELLFMDRLRADDREKAIELTRTRNGVTQAWFDPCMYDEIAGVDFGRGYLWMWYLYEGRGERVPLSKALEAFARLSRNTGLICESAHLGVPRRGQSMAQLFDADRLLYLYELLKQNGVDLRLAPEQHSRVMREWAANNSEGLVDSAKNTDINDAKALAYYCAHNNSLSLRKPPRTFGRCDGSRYGALVRAKASVVLNATSTLGYDGQVFPEIARLARNIYEGVRRPGGFVNEIIAFSIAASIATEEAGQLMRFTRNGDVVGWGSFKDFVLKFSPWHYSAGRARSNICHHGFRSFVVRYAKRLGINIKDGRKTIRFSDFNKEQSSAKAGAWKAVRDELRDTYRLGVSLTEEREPFEILRTETEAACEC